MHHSIEKCPTKKERKELVHESTGEDGGAGEEILVPRLETRFEDEQHDGKREGGNEVEDETLLRFGWQKGEGKKR